jgi:hypothetical protein
MEAGLGRTALPAEKPCVAICQHQDARGVPQMMILVRKPASRPRPDALGYQSDQEDYGSLICVCRERDCDGRWPIAGLDADNLPSRPYACFAVGPYLDAGRFVVGLMATIAWAGLVEPRAR